MFLSKKILLTSVCSCLVVNTAIALPFALFTTSVQAQSRRVRYVPPTNLDAPRVTASGVTRSSGCIATASLNCLIGLVPDLQTATAPVSLTISERPTIYFLIPKVDNILMFRLYEADGDLKKRGVAVYTTNFQVKSKAGIIALKTPDYVQSLKLDQNYVWEFVVKGATSDDVVSGSIRRVLPSQNLVDQLKKVSLPIDRAALFAKESIWYETVQTLAEAQQVAYQSPEVVNEWNDLLKSANLNRVLLYSFLKIK